MSKTAPIHMCVAPGQHALLTKAGRELLRSNRGYKRFLAGPGGARS